MRYLVTGSAGFVGFHVTDRLLSRGDEVVGIDNLNSYYDPSLKEARLARLAGRDGFRFERLDLADREGVARLFAAVRPEIVIHLAAQAGVRYSLTHPFAYADSNLAGFLTVLEGCRHHGVTHLVYASSSSVYGASARRPYSTDDAVAHPVSLYAASKQANELMAHVYSHLYRIPTTGLRFFTVYGPWGRPDMAYFSFTKALLEGRPIDVYNEGRMARDMTYVDDVVAGVLAVAGAPPAPDPSWSPAAPALGASEAPYRLYNLGNNAPVPLLAMIESLERALDRKAVKRLLPMQPGDVLETWADIAPMARDFNWRPSTAVDEGLRRFVAWYREFYRV